MKRVETIKKIFKERQIVSICRDVLYETYGKFILDPKQIDRPDAAINLESGKRIGIEVTTVQKEEVLEYLNDKKYGKDIESEVIKNIDKVDNNSSPLKKMPYRVTSKDIFDACNEKRDKYEDYKNEGKCHEVIILATGNDFCDENFLNESLQFFIKEEFNFDKVFIVNMIYPPKAYLFYDKSKPYINYWKNKNIKIKYRNRIVNSSWLPTEKAINVKSIAQKEPLIAPKK